MITINLDKPTQAGKLASPTPPIVAGPYDVQIAVLFSEAPGDDTDLFQLALTTGGSDPQVLAYTEDFAKVNDTRWTATLDASDTRLVQYMRGRGQVTLELEFTCVIDGDRVPPTALPVTVRLGAMQGAQTSTPGPVYLTQGQIALLYAPKASPTFTGVPAAPTAAPGTATTQIATTAFVNAGLVLKANLLSPAFTGTPTAPTAALGTDTDQLATTAYVMAMRAALLGGVDAAWDTFVEVRAGMIADESAATALATLVGTKQAGNANLTALSGLSLVADRLVYANGTGTLTLCTFTAAGRALLDDTDAAAQRATLGLAGARTLGTPVTATGAYVLPVPGGSPAAGDWWEVFITASGADRNLKMHASIVIPSDSTFDNATGKTLASGKTYIVGLKYSGSAWLLTTIVGGF